MLNPTYRREMIGDWDLRTASELTSYFGRHQYRAKIESPVYPPEHPQSPIDEPFRFDKGRYIDQLSGLLRGKNCIVVASPDVNPLTEIVLGKIYGVDDRYLFTEPVPMKLSRGAVIAVKEIRDKDGERGPKRAFYDEQPTGSAENARLRRGFRSNRIDNDAIWEPFVNQMDPVNSFEVFAHVAIASNPFEGSEDKHIIVLNGLSGPATYALTHVLTGGVSLDFVDYEAGFDREAESEKLLEKLLKIVVARKNAAHARRLSPALEVIVKVWVGEGRGGHARDEPVISDWRRIKRWEPVEDALHTQ